MPVHRCHLHSCYVALLSIVTFGTRPVFAQSTAKLAPEVTAQQIKTSSPPTPFAFGDFTWMNGANRQHKALMATPYVIVSALVDVNYNYSFNRPIDHTIVSSTVTARHNEFNLLMASIGGEFNYKGARATLALQAGSRTNLVQRNDATTSRGQYDLNSAMKYVREASAGYHFDALYGINLDVGIFMSYVGLASYIQHENWMYQPSYVSDNTPFYFKGLRLQVYPSLKTKVELWLVNGWQSYSKFHEGFGFGYQVEYRPQEWLALVANGYVGKDTRGAAKRVRMHSDNSIRVRYLERPDRLFSKAAISLTADAGCESGNGVVCEKQYFLGMMAYHRWWFAKNHLAWTQGGGLIQNPGRYLVLAPPGPVPFPSGPGTKFLAWDVSTTFDILPNEYLTWRFEVVHRVANVPYFAGRGGVTSPDGHTDTPVTDAFVPDRARSETRFIAAALLRF